MAGMRTTHVDEVDAAGRFRVLTDEIGRSAGLAQRLPTILRQLQSLDISWEKLANHASFPSFTSAISTLVSSKQAEARSCGRSLVGVCTRRWGGYLDQDILQRWCGTLMGHALKPVASTPMSPILLESLTSLFVSSAGRPELQTELLNANLPRFCTTLMNLYPEPYLKVTVLTCLGSISQAFPSMFRPFYDRALPLALSPLMDTDLAGLPEELIHASTRTFITLTVSYTRHVGTEGWVGTFGKVCSTLESALPRIYGSLGSGMMMNESMAKYPLATPWAEDKMVQGGVDEVTAAQIHFLTELCVGLLHAEVEGALSISAKQIISVLERLSGAFQDYSINRVSDLEMAFLATRLHEYHEDVEALFLALLNAASGPCVVLSERLESLALYQLNSRSRPIRCSGYRMLKGLTEAFGVSGDAKALSKQMVAAFIKDMQGSTDVSSSPRDEQPKESKLTALSPMVTLEKDGGSIGNAIEYGNYPRFTSSPHARVWLAVCGARDDGYVLAAHGSSHDRYAEKTGGHSPPCL
ncbi:hypothetical protein BJ684DRAFT_18048 [Piptocephalis cylindrospora]|uniref:Pre-rRNA-processing protein RIX1 n=1 Tax=Piptocephalis cylindrospora TaxID=1907219 RepID=A0A4P9XZ14_9FUNG|nr:hypothetical protein BJ684DRAFT_18048 [Piptocephalis cylindrospora]|eukprot:RKP11352.1 hypothetical protein BJ684DRAFT_18048 [Piptocephalis cylindrospora]